MRDLPLRQESCPAVVVMDAFGFFESEDENDRVLGEAVRILVPDGGLAMKVVNGEPILAEFRPTERQGRDGVVVAISRTLTVEPARMVERVSISGSRGDGHYERRLGWSSRRAACAHAAGYRSRRISTPVARVDAATSRSMGDSRRAPAV